MASTKQVMTGASHLMTAQETHTQTSQRILTWTLKMSLYFCIFTCIYTILYITCCIKSRITLTQKLILNLCTRKEKGKPKLYKETYITAVVLEYKYNIVCACVYCIYRMYIDRSMNYSLPQYITYCSVLYNMIAGM